MDPSRVLEPSTSESNQDHKRRCFDNLDVEVIDDTALIDVSCFKKKKSDVGFACNARIMQENDGKVKKNKGFKKSSAKSEKKVVNEKKVVGGRVASEKKVSEVKGFKGYRKTSGKVIKAVYVRKDAKVANVVEEQKKVSDDGLVVDEKMVGEAVQETNVSLNVLDVSNGKDMEDSALGFVESDVSVIVSNWEDQEESTVELVESESVDENDDVLKLNLEMDVVTGKIEVEEDRDVCESAIVGSKKVVYSREELEALRFVDEDGQTSKWIEVYCSFAPLVAREYTGLVVDTSRLTQRYNRAGSCGSTRYANDYAILGVPPVLSMCPVSSYRKIAPYDRVGFRANFN
ncbi:gem-associated protein 2 [Artemisia annua]|uniref:Gem-associated protein 2 n=1 Tax=Artemisia annua TaxID=35608 RepID=A0A2U1N2P0_ARTAN|nr:gem-associated protein 2 [Artemisia annua]